MLDAHLAHYLSEDDRIRQWWRQKTWLFNLIVGLTGLLTIIVEYSLINRPLGWLFHITPLVIIFGIGANMGYYMGAIIELFIKDNYPQLHKPNANKIIFWTGTALLSIMMIGAEIQILIKHLS